MTMKFKAEFNTDNDTFADNPVLRATEMAWQLRQLALRVSEGFPVGTVISIRDRNGNTIGKAYLTD
jgi:hypothetical protein